MSPLNQRLSALVAGADILTALEGQRLVTSQLLAARTEREGNFRYSTKRWSVKEVVAGE